ncbi:hypothetical protein ElyMa_003077900 [Elysia marginata]|uniref:Uncharacterized protein n=1 Tax=Elysia marginata TaxID=1093978 RepID=A0AAV4IPH5_9GAST|nr:hypothetical protein ElyMa_003077900 [Elysia marginata]
MVQEIAPVQYSEKCQNQGLEPGHWDRRSRLQVRWCALLNVEQGGSIFTTLASAPPGDLFATNMDCRNSEGLFITLFELLIYGQSGTCQEF